MTCSVRVLEDNFTQEFSEGKITFEIGMLALENNIKMKLKIGCIDLI